MKPLTVDYLIRDILRTLLAGMVVFLVVSVVSQQVFAVNGDPSAGLQKLLSRSYLPPDFDQDVFDELWTTWEKPLRRKASEATIEERRRMTMKRYGLLPRPDNSSLPMQYVVGDDGSWSMNCFACHQGQVNGEMIPGLPNSNYALETLTEDVRLVKIRQKKTLGHMDIGSMFLPLGTTNGTTNAVIFGVALMRYRDADLNLVTRTPRFDLSHHDMDAPPWWHYANRKTLYADGFAPQGHRMLMQFLLVKENGPAQFKEWENDFRDIEAWIKQLKSPRWPYLIDASLAREGEKIFLDHCAGCHGTYGNNHVYPERIIPIDEIATDRVRFDSLSQKERSDLNVSWFGEYGQTSRLLERRQSPKGYVAPPLDGVWATAPYFHNGSVPTLWHVLHPSKRPFVWRRTPTGYDKKHVGLEIEESQSMPSGDLSSAERRTWFDTKKFGKSAVGHDFPNVLTEIEKEAVLEYLKQL